MRFVLALLGSLFALRQYRWYHSVGEGEVVMEQRILLALIFAMMLSGCQPSVLSKDDYSISYQVRTDFLDNVDIASGRAQAYCESLGKSSRLEALTADIIRTVALFHCY